MKRQRFTVHTEGGPRVILAYDAEGARRYYETRGLTVRSIERGDYRQQAKIAAAKASRGYRLNRAALAAAIEQLELALPVDIRFHGRVGRTNGNYRLSRGRHIIMLKRYHDAEQASATLWHELAHAQQAERAGGTDTQWGTYVLRQKRWTYRRRPMELEANALARRMAHKPLCDPA